MTTFAEDLRKLIAAAQAENVAPQDIAVALSLELSAIQGTVAEAQAATPGGEA